MLISNGNNPEYSPGAELFQDVPGLAGSTGRAAVGNHAVRGQDRGFPFEQRRTGKGHEADHPEKQGAGKSEERDNDQDDAGDPREAVYRRSRMLFRVAESHGKQPDRQLRDGNEVPGGFGDAESGEVFRGAVGMSMLEIHRKRVAVNQCYWCKTVKICIFEMLQYSVWVPLCEECKKGFDEV